MEIKDKYCVAIDVGSTKVIVLVGHKTSGGRIRIVSGAVAPLRMGSVRRGEIENIINVTTAIKECIETIKREDNIHITEAVIGLTGQHVYCRQHTDTIYVENPDEISQNDLDKLEDNIWRVNDNDNYFIMNVIPIDYSIDSKGKEENPIGKYGNKLSGNYNVLYGDKAKITHLRKAVSDAGISISSLIPFSLAASEAVLTEDDKALGVTLVDIGSTSIEIAIWSKGVMRFMVTLPYGSSLLNNDIRAYGVVPRAVESLKVQYGNAVTDSVDNELVVEIPTNTAANHKSVPARTLSRIIEARLVEIGKGIKEMIALSGYSDKINNGIVLTGGGSKLKNIEVQFSRITNFGVRLGVPDFMVDGIDNDTIYDMSYATVIGMLIDSLNNDRYSTVDVNEKPIIVPDEPPVVIEKRGGKKKKENDAPPIKVKEPEKVKKKRGEGFIYKLLGVLMQDDNHKK